MQVDTLTSQQESANSVAADSSKETDENHLRDRARSAGAYAMLGRLAVSLIAFPTSLLLVKGLSLEDYGVYSLIGNLLYVASMITNLGTLGVVQRFVPEFAQKGHRSNVQQTVKIAAMIRLGGGLLASGALLLFSAPILSALNIPENYSYLSPILAMLILISVENQLLGNGVLAALLEQSAVTVGQTLAGVIKLTGIALCFQLGYGLQAVVMAWLTSLLIPAIYYAALTYKKVFAGPLSGNADLPKRRMFRYAGMSLATVFGTFVYDIAVDNVIIAYYLGPEQAGRYAFAVFTASLVAQLIPVRVLTPLLVNVAIRQYSGSGDKTILSKTFATASKVVAFTMIPGVVGLTLLSPYIISHILNDAYASVVPTVSVIVAFSLFRYLNFALQVLIKPLEILQVVIVQYACSVANLIMDIWWIPKYGIEGAAWATGLTLTLNYLLSWWLTSRHISARQDWSSLCRMALNVLIMSAVVWAAIPSITGTLSVLLVGILGALTYLVAARLNPCFTQEEQTLMNSIIGKNLFKF